MNINPKYLMVIVKTGTLLVSTRKFNTKKALNKWLIDNSHLFTCLEIINIEKVI